MYCFSLNKATHLSRDCHANNFEHGSCFYNLITLVTVVKETVNKNMIELM